MPFSPVSPFNPLTSPCGERPGFPTITTSPGGGVELDRELDVLQQDVFSWMVYFELNPIDPYTLNGNLWEMSQIPFERQYRTQGLPSVFGPAYAEYSLAILKLKYRSKGMRWYPGQGLVSEEMKPRMEQEPTGVVRTFGGQGPAKGTDTTQGGTLFWSSSDGNPNSTNSVYYGEHPHFESGGAELIITFPFAPTQNEPLRSGQINNADWTSLAINYTFPAGTLKYIGPTEEASVVIPAIGASTGLQRWRKSFLFHYRNPAINTAADTPGNIDWNQRYRSRDQKWMVMTDMNGLDYKQYPSTSYSAINWWL